jgi:ribosomal protein L7Ae-like RNA K-turn-binding protein
VKTKKQLGEYCGKPAVKTSVAEENQQCKKLIKQKQLLAKVMKK